MAPVPRDGSDTFKVLLTGFGPFSHYTSNPSWLAAAKLHDEFIDVPKSPGYREAKRIHVTAIEVPVTYDAILSVVPGFHQSPPVIPEDIRVSIPIPEKGYDFIMHTGVGRPGGLRVETRAHKAGYQKPDAEGKLAPPAKSDGDDDGSGVVRGFPDTGIYQETLDLVINDSVDVNLLVKHLISSENGPVAPSTDAGKFLCEYIYYCSLVHSEYECRQKASSAAKTPVLFMHVPDIDKPQSVADMANAMREVIYWCCQNSVKT
ncbi:peptidase C15, pyroglutamyl peptidase I-like protein [Sistotremastrum suecicum HHB10207 ss-3]|uniref:Peptidase C15, pyroglutamyl peptidase I-like protein n=1 Tax=Sistotremastrum suecicum HHB10207 ss-3 TaxID=1314776 RepID=A0A166DY91_9AGAM|nr:peptidase C15, pyroglutamyl peptidase I-like protein [Sistotremastrum suecicum HHB10207 ss-3]